MVVIPRVNVEGYEINPVLLDMLHTKKIVGDDIDDMKDRILTLIYLEIYVGLLS
jgi:hypothetical protein